MSEHLPIESEVIADLLNNPVIIKIVTILDIKSLSILDLLEYEVNIVDFNYALARRVIQLERPNTLPNKENDSIGIPEVGGDYYYEFLNSKVSLTEIGVYILDCLKSDQPEHKTPNKPKDPYSETYPHYHCSI